MAEWTDPKRVCVLVCGERLRGDDAAAVLAAEMLPTDALALAEVIEVGLLSVEALLDVPEGVAVIVADAAVGVAAGEVVVLPLASVARSTGSGAALASSHSLPPDQVLALAEALRGSLPRGVFVGIGGAEFGFGERLSAPVAAGLPAFVTALAGEIRRLAAD
jgi:hydrogenase maturation protease